MDDEQLTAREQARLEAVADLLADPEMWMGPTVGVEDAVLAAIRGEPRAAPPMSVPTDPPRPPIPPPPPMPPPPPLMARRPAVAPPTADHAPRPPAPPTPVIPLEQAPSARRRSWVTVATAAVASAAAAVLITTAVVRRDQSDQRTATSGNGSRKTFMLQGTELAPSVVGTAVVSVTDSGTRLAIQLTGLDDRRNGDFYQVWLSDCAKTVLIPAGSFHNFDDVVAWAGVSLKDFPRVTVTAESAAAGDEVGQESSGEVYAIGMIGTCPG